MGLKSNNGKNFIILSPLEVRHFLVDIPPVKEQFKREAVLFALQQLYPVAKEITAVDYFCCKEKTAALAAPTERITQLKKKGSMLVSAAALIACTMKNGISLCAGETWFEIEVMKDGSPVYLQCYDCLKNDSEVELKKIASDPAFSGMTVTRYTATGGTASANGREVPLESLFTNRSLKYASVFTDRSRSNPFSRFGKIAAPVLLLLALGVTDVTLHREAGRWRSAQTTARTSYEAEKTRVETAGQTSGDTAAGQEYVHSVSVWDVLHEIHHAAEGIRLISFSMDGDSFRFEAEHANSLSVLTALGKSALFETLQLVQAVPASGGGERFVMTGTVNHE